MENLQERIFKMIAEHFKVAPNKVTLETRFIADLGADSLDIVEFVLALEDEFNITIADSQAQNISTVQETVTHIELILNKG